MDSKRLSIRCESGYFRSITVDKQRAPGGPRRAAPKAWKSLGGTFNSTKAGLAGAMDAVGIGESTISGIKSFISAKVEQNRCDFSRFSPSIWTRFGAELRWRMAEQCQHTADLSKM